MAKNKQQKFNEMETFTNVFQPSFDSVFNNRCNLKGKWNKYFNNNNPIVLELGCGKGEYTVNLAQVFPEKNFIGVDIKGARIWKGAKFATENKIVNTAFLRTRIEFINSCFSENEISEIWITFPDPQLKKQRVSKRLTSSGFLNKYKLLLQPNGIIHLKTDSKELYDYTHTVLSFNNITTIKTTHNLYNSETLEECLNIKTFYEEQFLGIGKSITYIQFKLNNTALNEPPQE